MEERKMRMILAVCLLAVGLCAAAPSGALIESLPGLSTTPSFRQYSGYLPVNPHEAHPRKLFYWFVESQDAPHAAPLVVWFQGGPGCSSLFGLLGENGPFRVAADGHSLEANPHSWNRKANVLYIEAPAGVGFSVNSDPSGTTGDNQTMADNYAALTSFLQQYPEYAASDLYLSGESYGGHYVPQLAWTILQQGGGLNLKGILVGNPYVSDALEMEGLPGFIYYHALCSREAYETVLRDCAAHKVTTAKGHVDMSLRRPVSADPVCQKALDKMMDQVGKHINQYDIYWPCTDNGSGLDCSDFQPIITYLNQEAVQKAIHAEHRTWTMCADVRYVSAWPTVANIYPALNAAMRVTLYSGDVTFNVPFTSTERMIESLNMSIVEEYHAWMHEGQVGGYIQKYSGMNYVTVRDSGHMVPLYTPALGYTLLERYLAGVF